MGQQGPRNALLFLVFAFSLSSTSAEVCADITDGEQCVQHEEGLVYACEWCATDGQCHGVGSVDNPCSASCCGSLSPFAGCKHHHPDQIPPSCAGFAPNTTAFEEAQALRGAYFVSAAYCDAAQIMDWSCIPCSNVTGFTPLTVATDHDLNLQAFVGIDRSGASPVRVVSFRGTVETSIMNWITNLKIDMIKPYETYPQAAVHLGFYQSWTSKLRQQVVGVLREPANLPTAPVWVVGHSLGGALAFVSAFDLQNFQDFNVSQVATYGQPRVGNRAFMQAYKKTVPNNWRMTHHNDIVPHIPTTFQGYDHTSREVYYPRGGQNHTICDGSGEDMDCSNRCAKTEACTSVSDHLTYLGVPQGSGPCHGLLFDPVLLGVSEHSRDAPKVDTDPSVGQAQWRNRRSGDIRIQ